MKYTKEVSFYNLFLQKDDSVTLSWDFPDGFSDVNAAKEAVSQLGQNPELFLYIKHHGFLYAVATYLLEQAIVISERYIWYRESPTLKITRVFRKSSSKLPYLISSCKTVDYYKKALCQDMFSFDPDIRIICGKKVKDMEKEYKDFCVATLGAVMNTSMIPVYQLNCMDSYFKNITSFLDLWKLGIKTYNPFTGYHQIASYTLQSYLIDREKTKEEVSHLTSIRDYFLNQGVMRTNNHSNIEVPSFMAKELLLLVNGALSSMGEENSFAVRNMELQQQLKGEHTSADEETRPYSTEYHMCRVCHITLPENYQDNICPMCQENELFMSVKDFIREYDVNENDVAEHFDIPISKVRGWIKEGRISYKEMRGIRSTDSSKAARICRECGMVLPPSCKDNICKSCANIAEASKKKHIQGKLIATPNPLDQDSSMRYGRKIY